MNPAQQPAAPQTQPAQHPFDETVLLTATVTDTSGRFVSGLRKSDVTVYSDNVQQEISIFEPQEDVPAAVGIIFDISGDIRFLTVARNDLLRLIDASNKANSYFIIGFDKQGYLLTDWTSDRDAIVDGLNELALIKNKHGAALYDACYMGIQKVLQNNQQRHIIILISGTEDTESTYSFRQKVHDLLKRSNVTIFSVGNIPDYASGVLERMANESGGVAYLPNTTAELDEIFESIVVELRSQYLIGFKPVNVIADGRWHTVKIKASLPSSINPKINLNVRSRGGYFAPSNTH
ncbi:MAG: hypothetical protein AUG51_22835 [Acidobacteria bacterium 13_1_20CM_3_53_8]|nr:MAG: hypothetical protein AUG51_22835 [Acidobacteria bacterium 13_1_20CM_3_53_8]